MIFSTMIWDILRAAKNAIDNAQSIVIFYFVLNSIHFVNFQINAVWHGNFTRRKFVYKRRDSGMIHVTTVTLIRFHRSDVRLPLNITKQRDENYKNSGNNGVIR